MQNNDEKMMQDLRNSVETKTEWNIDPILLSFLSENVFYAEISRRLHKEATTKIPTAAVTWDPELDSMKMMYNPEFLSQFTPQQVRGVIKHEMGHLIYGHLNARRRVPANLWNIATDLAINSLICAENKKSYNKSSDQPLPDCALIPGRAVYLADKKRFITPAEEADMPIARMIRMMKPLLSSEEYFAQFQILKSVDDDFGDQVSSLDDHDMWDDIGDDEREYVETRIHDIIEKAVQRADQQSNGWGNIPTEISSAIRKSIQKIIPWQKVLRQFIGTLQPGGRKTSIKRINKRYPYIQPGVKRARNPGLLIAIDQSGSVSDTMLATFFAEIQNLAKICNIDVVAFDTVADKNIIRWNRNTPLKLERTRMGGTSFDAVSNVVNDPKNRGRWDGVLIVTDGAAPQPVQTRIKRGWVLAEGQRLYFDSKELQVFISKNAPMKGIWR